MIGEVREGSKWGGNRKAANRTKDRAAQLQSEGFEVYTHDTKSLNGDKQYYVFAFGEKEDFDSVKVVTPENEHTRGRRLNARTIHIGMQVAVEHVNGEEINGHHNRRGVVKGVMLEDEGLAVAYVQFRDDPHVHTKIEVFRLRQVAR